MVKYREILRLAAMGVSQRSIAYSCGCGQSTISDVPRAARAHGIAWPLLEEMDDATIRLAIYPDRSRKASDKAPIDHERIASELNRRGMTMSLLWNEYCDAAIARGEEPYMYSAFCNVGSNPAVLIRESQHPADTSKRSQQQSAQEQLPQHRRRSRAARRLPGPCGPRAPAGTRRRRRGKNCLTFGMVDRLVHGSVRIDLGDVNVRKLLADVRAKLK